MKKNARNGKGGNIAKAGGTAGATAGGLGTGFMVCHTVCQSLVSVLAVLGIAVLGMPLAFLEPYSIPLLALSAASLGFSIWLCRKHSMPMRTLLKPIAIGLVAAAVIVFSAFLFSAYSEAGAQQYQDPNQELPAKCATPAGYTDESWREHMGHHPGSYAECLGNLPISNP